MNVYSSTRCCHCTHIQTLIKVVKRGGEELKCLCFTDLTISPVKTQVFISYVHIQMFQKFCPNVCG